MSDGNGANVEPLWTSKEVSGFLRLSRSWVYLHAEAGDLPCLRFGGVVRFDPAAIRAYARGAQPPTSPIIPFPARSR